MNGLSYAREVVLGTPKRGPLAPLSFVGLSTVRPWVPSFPFQERVHRRLILKPADKSVSAFPLIFVSMCDSGLRMRSASRYKSNTSVKNSS